MEHKKRIFKLFGNKCIACDKKCPPSTEGGSVVFAFNPSWAKMLGVSFSSGWTNNCLSDEDPHNYRQSDPKSPEIKQPDGITPRICLLHISSQCVVNDLKTGETFTTTSPVRT